MIRDGDAQAREEMLMLRLRDNQASLWEVVLPPEMRMLSPELAAIDALLDDQRFLQPFVNRFHCAIGRPTVPIETYLRLMYLKHRYSLGYETLVKEVGDSVSWRRFCRLNLEVRIPHSTTLVKLTRRFGPEIVDDLNQTLLRQAVEDKVLRSRRVRVDTTVMEADVRYPTDSGLCAHAISRISRVVSKIKASGMATRTRFRHRVRSAGKLIRKVSHALGRVGSKGKVEQHTKALQQLVSATVRAARRVLGNAKRSVGGGHERGAHLVPRLATELVKAERVVEQTARRFRGETAIPDRMISLADPDARPIRRGKPKTPTEFGYKVSIADTPEGFIVSHQVYTGAPSDTETLQPAIAGVVATGMKTPAWFADRGYGNEKAAEIFEAMGVTDTVIPRVGKAAATEQTAAWKRRYRCRCGAEGRISQAKRKYGLRRTRLKGHTGAEIWTGLGVFAHNIDIKVAVS